MKKSLFESCVDCGSKKSRPNTNPRCRKCAVKKSWESNDSRKNDLSKDASERWKDNEFRERMRNLAGDALRERWKDESYRQSQSERVSQQSAERWSKEEYRERLSLSRKEAWKDEEYRRSVIQNRAESLWQTKSDPEWRIKQSIRMGGDGDIERLDARRNSIPWLRTETRRWTTLVKKRDGRKCRNCGSTCELHAHHIKPRGKFPELAFDLSNGITLCRDCHVEEHHKMRLAEQP